MTTLAKVIGLVSGQCAWIGRHDIHCYCRHPMREVIGEHGRPAWRRFPAEARYAVICPDAGLNDQHWITAAEAAATIDFILARETAHVA